MPLPPQFLQSRQAAEASPDWSSRASTGSTMSSAVHEVDAPCFFWVCERGRSVRGIKILARQAPEFGLVFGVLRAERVVFAGLPSPTCAQPPFEDCWAPQQTRSLPRCGLRTRSCAAGRGDEKHGRCELVRCSRAKHGQTPLDPKYGKGQTWPNTATRELGCGCDGLLPGSPSLF